MPPRDLLSLHFPIASNYHAPSVQDGLLIQKTDYLQKPRYEEQKRLIDAKAALRQRNLNPKRIGIVFYLGSDHFPGNHYVSLI